MSLFYDLNGRRHEISHDEVEAIERTGTPHRVQDYAAGYYGRGYFDVTKELMGLSVRVMDSRPGQTEPGASPPEKPKKKPTLGRWGDLAPYHVADVPRGYRAACGRRGLPGALVLPEKAFRAITGDMPVCMRCARILGERTPCRPPEVKVVRWSDKRKAALREWRKSMGVTEKLMALKRSEKANWITGW